jgi:hypothetical protein
MKNIAFKSVKNYTKQEIAELQLDRAIRIFLDEEDFISAITLAGAAEEILGELLERQGKTSSLTAIVNECVHLGKAIGYEWKVGTFKQMMNFFRNEMKHHHKDEGFDNMPVPVEAVHEIINRAAENLRRLTGTQSEQVQRFNSRIGEA